MAMPIWLTIFSDLFVNLAAGWVGAVVIVPNFTHERGRRKFFVLTGDILAIILCLVMAFIFRRIL